MLFMDLTVNNQTIFTGQFCPGQTLLRPDAYLGVTGSLVFLDFSGFADPTYDQLNARYQLMYWNGTDVPLFVPLSATPVQSLFTILNNQNCVIGLYDQLIDTTVPSGAALPTGADASYVAQSFLAPYSAYADPSYAPGYAL